MCIAEIRPTKNNFNLIEGQKEENRHNAPNEYMICETGLQTFQVNININHKKLVKNLDSYTVKK